MSAPTYPNEKSVPPPGAQPSGAPPHASAPPPIIVQQQQQPYTAPANRPLQAGVGAPNAQNPECRHYGHDTHIGCGGITFLVCCFPWSMIW